MAKRMAAIAAIILLLALPAVAAEDQAAARRQAARLLEKGGAQTELPGRGATRSRTPPARTITISGDTAMYLLAAAVLVFAVVLLVLFLDNARSAGGGGLDDRDARPDEEAVHEVRSRMRAVKLEAEELAARGCFAEAIHVLLLQSLTEMRIRLRVPISESLTSREILRRVELDPAAHAALADIIGRVEISYFGRHEPGAEEYAACRSSYDGLLAALTRKGAAI